VQEAKAFAPLGLLVTLGNVGLSILSEARQRLQRSKHRRAFSLRVKSANTICKRVQQFRHAPTHRHE
jgi:hypothetical protein